MFLLKQYYDILYIFHRVVIGTEWDVCKIRLMLQNGGLNAGRMLKVGVEPSVERAREREARP